MKPLNKNQNPFKKWLANKGLSYQQFSERSGISYPTVVTWAHGTRPRTTAKKVLKQKFPDCPLVDE